MSAGEQAGKPGLAPPDDIVRLREEIKQTRSEIGATVEDLASRADVKTRARMKSAELSRQLKSRAATARETTRRQARGAVAKGVGSAKEHPAPVAGTAFALALSCLAVRGWRSRAGGHAARRGRRGRGRPAGRGRLTAWT